MAQSGWTLAHRVWLVGGICLGPLLALGPLDPGLLGPTPASAQFGFFYGSPQPRRTYRPRRTVTPPRPQVVPPQTAEIPLPPPRPHFPGDPPAPADVATDGEPDAGQAGVVPSQSARPAEVPKAPPAAVTPAAPAPAAQNKPALGPNPPPLPPEKPAELPKQAPVPATPGVAASGAKLGETPRQPDDDATCPSRLAARNVVVEPTTIGPQSDARCTVVQAVHLKGLTLPDGAKVDFPEHPTIACTTAEAFSSYVRDLLSPLAKGTFGAPVSAVWTGPGLECRSMDHILGAKLSAHGQGLAIDIAQVKLADGRMIEVGQAKDAASQTFETAARNAACGYFHTVLGPGTDSYHRTHWHFDLLVRGAQGDSKYCR